MRCGWLRRLVHAHNRQFDRSILLPAIRRSALEDEDPANAVRWSWGIHCQMPSSVHWRCACGAAERERMRQEMCVSEFGK